MTGEPQKNVAAAKQAAASWISSADTKATTILALSGVLLSIMVAAFSIGSRPQNLTCLQCVELCLFGLASLAATIAALSSLYPRTNRRALLSSRGWPPRPYSLSYYGDLASLSPKEFASRMQESPSEDELEQAFVLAVIAKIKMRWLRLSVLATAISLLSLTAFWLSTLG